MLLAACSSESTVQAHEIVAQKGYTLATVTDVQVQPHASDLFRVDVWAQGPLESRCFKIGQAFEDRNGSDIYIVLTLEESKIPDCNDGVNAEFVQISPLESLAPGIYNLTIHGITRTFEISESGVVRQ